MKKRHSAVSIILGILYAFQSLITLAGLVAMQLSSSASSYSFIGLLPSFLNLACGIILAVSAFSNLRTWLPVITLAVQAILLLLRTILQISMLFVDFKYLPMLLSTAALFLIWFTAALLGLFSIVKGSGSARRIWYLPLLLYPVYIILQILGNAVVFDFDSTVLLGSILAQLFTWIPEGASFALLGLWLTEPQPPKTNGEPVLNAAVSADPQSPADPGSPAQS